MIPSAAIRKALATFSGTEAQLLRAARWASECDEIDDDTISLYVAPAFLEMRLRQTDGLADLIDELSLLYDQSPHAAAMRLIGNALQLSAPALRRSWDQLPTQLLARLPVESQGWIAELRKNLLAEYPDAPRPIRTALLNAQHTFFIQPVTQTEIVAMECSPDGSLVAVLDSRGHLELAIPEPGGLRGCASIRCQDALYLSFTPSGRFLILGARSRQIWTIDTASRTIVNVTTAQSEVSGLSCIDDERLLASLESGVCILRARDGKPLIPVGAEEGLDLFSECAVASKAGLLLLGGMDGRVDAWKTDDGHLAKRVGWFGPYSEGFESRAAGMMKALIGGGGWMVGSDAAQRLDVEEMLSQIPGLSEKQRAAMGRELAQPAHRHVVTALAVSADETTAIAGSISGELRLWDLSTGEPQGWWRGKRGDIMTLVLDPDGDHLYLGGGDDIQVWSRSRRAPAGRLQFTGPKPTILKCLPGQELLLGARDDGTVVGWNLNLVRLGAEQAVDQDRLVQLAAPRPGGRLWAVAKSGRTEEWDLIGGARISNRPPPKGVSRNAAFSLDGRRLAMCASSGLLVQDVGTGLPMYWRSHSGWRNGRQIRALAVSEDGRKVIVAAHQDGLSALIAADGSVELVDMSTGEVLVLDPTAGLVSNISLSADGRFAVASMQGRRQSSRSIWDLSVHPPKLVKGTKVKRFTLCRDGTILWVDDQGVEREKLADGGAVAGECLKMPGCQSLVLSPGERFAAAINIRGEAIVWDLERQLAISGFCADRPIVSAALAPVERRLAVLDADGFLHILEVPPLAVSDETSFSAPTDALTTRLETFATFDWHQDPLGALEELAQLPQAAGVLVVSIALRLASLGRRERAIAILEQHWRNLPGTDLPKLIDALAEMGARETMVTILGDETEPDSQQLDALTRAAEWLISHEGRADLTAVAKSRGASVRRLIAAQALAEADEGESADALRDLVSDANLNENVRLAAVISLSAVLEPSAWLNFVEHKGARQISPTFAQGIAPEIVRVLSSVPVLATYPQPQVPIAPLRRPMDWNSEAMRLTAEGDYDAAYNAASMAIRRRPAAARYYHTRGMASLSAARAAKQEETGPIVDAPGRKWFEAAIADLTLAVERDRSYDAAWSQRGYAYLELEDFEVALQDISEAIRLSETPSLADLQNRAVCLHNLGRHDEAKADESAAEEIANHGEDDHYLFVHGRTRAGDDPDPDGAEMEEIHAAARRALHAIGEMSRIRHELVETLRRPGAPAVLGEARRLLGVLGDDLELHALHLDDSVDLETRVSAAEQLLKRHPDDIVITNLTKIAQADFQKSVRAQAAFAIAEFGEPEQVVTLLRGLQDVTIVDQTPSDGLIIGLSVLKSLDPAKFPVDRLAELARDRRAAPHLREITGEAVASRFNQSIGVRLLKELASEFPASHSVRDSIEFALAHFSGSARAPERSVRPEQIAFDAFVAARAVEEVDELARKFRILRDPEFVDQAASVVTKLPPNERPLFQAKLDRLRALPPDPELVGFRSFARCRSPEEMRELVTRFPFLSLPSYHAKIEQIIVDTDDKDARPALERRLAWLRRHPPDPLQAALQAFSEADNAEALRAAVEAHPHLSRSVFHEFAANVLGRDQDWPRYAERLKLLKTLTRQDDVERAIEAASDHLKAHAPDLALEAMRAVEGTLEGRGELLQAEALLETGRETEAIEAFTRAIERMPSRLALARRGKAYLHLQRPDAALADFNEALRLDDSNFDVWLGRGITHAALGNPEAAIADLTRAEAFNSDEFMVCSSRAGQYLALGNVTAAIADFRRAIRAEPEMAMPRIFLAKLLWGGPSHAEAVTLLAEARRCASAEELPLINEMERPRNRDTDGVDDARARRAFELFIGANSVDALRAAMAHEPILYETETIDALERHAESAPAEIAKAYRERLSIVKRLAKNKAQWAFDSLMTARSLSEISAARARHDLLRDGPFLAELARVAGQIEDAESAARLRAALRHFESLSGGTG